MKLLNDRIETLFKSLDATIADELDGEAPAEAVELLLMDLLILRQAIKDAVVDAYIEARGERK